MELTPADQDRGDLGQLARIAGEPVRLCVDDEEFRGLDW